MGNQCFATTPNQVYNQYLQSIKPDSLRNKWSKIQLFKIRKIFTAHSSVCLQSNKQILSIQSIKEIFCQFKTYEGKEIKRLFEMFDYQRSGYIDWSNFLTTVSICYYSSVKILSILMFMIFDQSLAKTLNYQQINRLVQFNFNYLYKINQTNNDYICQSQDIADFLLDSNQHTLSIDRWILEAPKVFNFNKYRHFFNVFTEEQMQKQIIKNFYQWNQLFDQDQSKFISYVIDFKWFQLWSSYVFSTFGVKLNASTKNPNTLKTLKSFRTKKSFKTLQQIKSQKKNLLQLDKKQLIQNSIIVDKKQKNINLIHSEIGSKPLKMFNKQLQCQYSQVLVPQLIQNMNYVLVSEKIWSKLKFIYNGYPQFRRTGINSIELYPKRIKLYSQLFYQKLDYSSIVIREVTGATRINELLMDSIGLQQEEINKLSVFYKLIGMPKWEQIYQFAYRFVQITTQAIIFIAYFHSQSAAIFRKSHCKAAQKINQINIGDEIKYPLKGEMQKAIYMGETQDGKQIVHFKGQSYIYDLLVSRQQLNQKGILSKLQNNILQDLKISSLDIPLFPLIKSFSFINSLIIMFISNPEMKIFLNQFDQNVQSVQILDQLSSLYKMNKKKCKLDTALIMELIQNNMIQFLNFQFSMVEECYLSFLQLLDQNFQFLGITFSIFRYYIFYLQVLHFQFLGVRNIVRQSYYFKSCRKQKCMKCNDITQTNQLLPLLNVVLPQSIQKYYTFTYVPFSSGLTSLQIKKYGLRMKSPTTYKQYRKQISKLIQCIDSNFIICQSYGNDIIRNFSKINDQSTLQQINIKQNDQIYVYQMCNSFNQFIIDHYTQVKDINIKKFRIGQLVDCKLKQDQWFIGKIIQIQLMPYTQKTFLKVQHRFVASQKTSIQHSYQLCNTKIAIFPTMSYQYAQHYHIKLLQRCYNQTLNEMQLCNMPLIIVLTNWMRCKQFEFVIYQQLKSFISPNYRFKDFCSPQDDDQQIKKPNILSYKQSKKHRIKTFQNYLDSDMFPYTINILDLSGRCLICHKIHQSLIPKGQSDYYCNGCTLNRQDPILWQLKIDNCMICVDWLGIQKLKRTNFNDHKSLSDMMMKKKNYIETLQKLIDQKFKIKNQMIHNLCCDDTCNTMFFQEIKTYPQYLVIHIQRLINNGNQLRINRKNVNFPQTDFKIGKRTYDLAGLICIQGVSTILYKSYVLNQNQQWYEIHGQTVKKLKKNQLNKLCALFLIYNMKQSSVDLLDKISDCQQLQQIDTDNNDQKRKNNKKITIYERLMNYDNQFSFLNTQKSDQIEVDQFEKKMLSSESQSQQSEQSEQQQGQSNQIQQKVRSINKKQVKYYRDSKSIIKSASQCSKSSKSSKDSKRNKQRKLQLSKNSIFKQLKSNKYQQIQNNHQQRTQTHKITIKFNKIPKSMRIYQDEYQYQNENVIINVPQHNEVINNFERSSPQLNRLQHDVSVNNLFSMVVPDFQKDYEQNQQIQIKNPFAINQLGQSSNQSLN